MGSTVERGVRRPSLPETVAIGVFTTLVAIGPLFVAKDGDTLTHAVIGQAILTGGWPTTDPLLEPAVPIQLHEWGYEVLLALAHSAVGNAGYVLVGGFFVSLAIGLALQRMVERAGAWPALLLAALGFPTLLLHLHARPHVVSWCAIVVLVLLLERAREHGADRGFVAACGALGLAWANLHGGFLIAGPVFAAFAIDALRRPDRALWLGGAATFGLGTLVNPDGPWLHVHLVRFLADPEARAPIVDLAPTDLTTPAGLILLVWTGLGLFLLRRGPASHGVLTLILAVLTFRMMRTGPLYALATAPLFATGRGPEDLRAASARLEALFDPRSTGRWPLVVWLVALFSAPLWSPSLPASTMPVEALRTHAAHHLDGPGLAVFRWGGAVVHERPESRVFIHPLNALYPRQRQRDYATLLTGDLSPLPPGLGWALVEPGTPLETALRDAGWTLLHEDPLASLWRRPDAP